MLIPHFYPASNSGGVPFSGYNLAKSLLRKGHAVTVFTSNRDGESFLDVKTNCFVDVDGLSVWYQSTLDSTYNFSSIYKVAFPKIIKCDLILSSSTLWNFLGFLSFLSSFMFKKTIFFYPRGLLDPWAMRKNNLLKRLILRLYGLSFLKRSYVIALSLSELQTLKNFEESLRVFVIPNGAFLSSSPSTPGNYILFLGRITQKKGIDITIDAFVRYSSLFPDKELVFAGPIDNNYKDIFYKLVSGKKNIKYIGSVFGDQKANLISNCSFLMLNSHSEGMPMSVLETLGSGKPVIISPDCNIPEVEDFRAGFVVENSNASAIVDHMVQLTTDIIFYNECCESARHLVSTKFSWDVIGDLTLDLYNEI